ncbi:hypothetical protein ACOZ4F_14205 [Haloarcula marismortui]|uniref:hypothetical protein n=1 Tax=Haloarcula marismortui TaxID=2238 RepID=UPI003C78F32A
MSASGDGPRLSRSLSYIRESERLGGFDSAFVQGLGGIVLMISSVIIGIGEALATLVTRPSTAFSEVTALLIRAGFGAPARFLQDSWNTAAVQLGMGPWTSLGPFVAVLAVIVVVLAIVILNFAVGSTGADTLTGISIPGIGRADTDEELTEEE